MLRGKPVGLDGEGNLPLTAGKGYTLRLAHYQYQAPATEISLSVMVPKAVDLVVVMKLFSVHVTT